MRYQAKPRSVIALRNSLVFVVLAVWLGFALAASAEFASGVYQTAPGATVEEIGDYVTNRSRVVPLTATLAFDLTAEIPSLTAVIHNAVLEGGSRYADHMLGGREQPFELAVRSLSGTRLADASYRFMGDYLQDIYPSGTQYGFDWRFSSDSEGRVWWNGYTGWMGGHLWLVRIAEVELVPEANTLALLGVGGGLLCAVRRRRAGRSGARNRLP